MREHACKEAHAEVTTESATSQNDGPQKSPQKRWTLTRLDKLSGKGTGGARPSRLPSCGGDDKQHIREYRRRLANAADPSRGVRKSIRGGWRTVAGTTGRDQSELLEKGDLTR